MQDLLLEKIYSPVQIQSDISHSIFHSVIFLDLRSILKSYMVKKHTLTLTRGSDTQSVYRANGVPDGKVDITSIAWHMPQIQISPGVSGRYAFTHRTKSNDSDFIHS